MPYNTAHGSAAHGTQRAASGQDRAAHRAYPCAYGRILSLLRHAATCTQAQ